ncbi:MAG: hypothetical protein AB7E37_05670 [Candidatus Altimarinota bacterium]
MNKKIINNAISAYFGLSALLLLPSKKENLNHPFVKKHAKTALFIHFMMLINYIIFISYKFLGSISFMGFYLNHVLASIIFLGLFGWILYGAYKASIGDDFGIKEIGTMTKTDTIVQIKNSNLNEQGILTIILSLIPFLGFVLKGRFYNYKSPIIENNIKINLIATVIISFTFTQGYENIGFLLLLGYLIFIGFYSILLIGKQNIISFDVSKIPTLEEIYFYVLAFIKYLKNYFGNKSFTGLQELIKKEKENYNAILQQDKTILEALPDEKLNKIIAYIPYLNVLSLIDMYSKNRNHIINGLLITIVSSILFLLGQAQYQIFLIILVFFGVGYTKKREYRFPFLFDIYMGFAFIFGKIFSSGKKAINLQKEVKEVSFEIEK